MYKTVAQCWADAGRRAATLPVIFSTRHISIGSLDSNRLKTELHNSTDEHRDARPPAPPPTHRAASL